MSKAKAASNKLKKEASDILHMFFKIPNGTHSNAITRLVDCIVMAATLETADVQAEAMKEARGE